MTTVDDNSQAESPPMLDVVNAVKRYGDHVALDGLSLQVHAGEILCLLGANGAGKTTTIHMLLGFVEPTSGDVRVGGLDVRKHSRETKQFVAYIPEVVVLYEHLTAVENLEFLCALGGTIASAEATRGYLVEAGLALDAVDRRVGTFSKGMRQKVGIALALARNSKALLLDEPLSGLDPRAASEFVELVRRRAERGMAVLMATHDLYRAKEIATRVGILKNGRLVDMLRAADLSHSDLERLYLTHMRS